MVSVCPRTAWILSSSSRDSNALMYVGQAVDWYHWMVVGRSGVGCCIAETLLARRVALIFREHGDLPREAEQIDLVLRMVWLIDAEDWRILKP